MVRTRSESLEIETEVEQFFDNQAQLDANTPTQWFERSMSFEDDTDGGYSMIQAITSSQGEDMIRTETYHEDGTTTITIKGTVWFEGMLVQNAEITEQLDQYWNHTDYSGTSEIPNDMLENLTNFGIHIDNTKVLISFEGAGDYGQPLLKFTVIATEDIYLPDMEGNPLYLISAKDQILNDENGDPMVMTNYEEQGNTALDGYALTDGWDYVTSRKDWTWNQETFDVGGVDGEKQEQITTFTGIKSDDSSQTITVVETKKLILNSDYSIKEIVGLTHHVTTSRDEDYTINFNIIDKWNRYSL